MLPLSSRLGRWGSGIAKTVDCFNDNSLSFAFTVPPKALYIKDKSDQLVYAIAGPYNEDDALDLMCIAENGKLGFSFIHFCCW